MRALTYLGIVLFYFHYYFLLALFSFCNVFKYLFKLLTQKSTEKQSISPYEVVHKDVFTNRRKHTITQIKSSRTKVTLSRPSLFKLRIRFTSKCGESTAKTPLLPNPTLFYSCTDFWTAQFPGSCKWISNSYSMQIQESTVHAGSLGL